MTNGSGDKKLSLLWLLGPNSKARNNKQPPQLTQEQIREGLFELETNGPTNLEVLSTPSTIFLPQRRTRRRETQLMGQFFTLGFNEVKNIWFIFKGNFYV